MGIRAKLFLVLFLLIVASVAAVDVYISLVLERRLTESVSRDLRIRLELVRSQLERENIAGNDAGAWKKAVDQLSEQAQAQITVVRRDGPPIADPEVVQALQGAEGFSVRDGEDGRRVSYVALPFRQGGQLIGAVRAAEPLAAVEDAVANVHRTLLSSLLLATIVAGAVSILAAERAAALVRKLTESASRMAAGDLEVRTRAQGGDELAELGRALDLLAVNLSAAIGALRKERDLLGGIVSAMHEGLLVLDDAGRIAVTNPALREMLQLGSDAVGKYPREVIRHPDFASLLEQCKRSVKTAQVEIELVRLKPAYLLLHAVRIAETGGLLIVFVDVTEIRRLERVRTDFVANVSHELRTPITAIRGYAETLRAGALSDRDVAANMVEIIFRQSERLSRLVEDLLELSRLEAREFMVSQQPVLLLDTAQRASDAVRPRAESKGIRLEIEVPSDLRALGDERALEQVLLNLLDNAVKYMPGGGEVKIAARVRDGRCEIEVRDNGLGIEAKHLSRLFERFYRVDKGRSRDMGGTGLGLAIVKHLVAAMNGEVLVASTPGAGSTFTVVLPQAARTSLAIAARA